MVDAFCMLCHESKQVRHVNLYIIGSEGLYACHECEMLLVEFARSLSSENSRRKLHAAQQKMHPTLGESAVSDSESKPAPKRVI